MFYVGVVVAKSFENFAQKEIEYRKGSNPDLTAKQALQDTIDTCLIITKRGKGNDEEKTKYALLQKGILAFGTGYLMDGKFRIDEAIIAVAKVAYLAGKILKNDLTQIKRYNGEDIKQLIIDNPEWNFLNRLKRQPDKSSFFYWYHTMQLLSE